MNVKTCKAPVMHECGGTILTGAPGDVAAEHLYCDRCGAFIYTAAGATVPPGTNRARNRATWDDGDDRSPSEP